MYPSAWVHSPHWLATLGGEGSHPDLMVQDSRSMRLCLVGACCRLSCADVEESISVGDQDLRDMMGDTFCPSCIHFSS